MSLNDPTAAKLKTSEPNRRAGVEELALPLVLCAQRGEQGACRALVVRYQRPVFALLSRMLAGRPGHRALVEDLAQDTFLKVFRGLPSFDPDGSAQLSTWVLTIATRVALDELRRRVREEPLDHRVIALPARHRTDARADAHAVGRAIERAVAELAPEFRAVFLLREYHGLSYDAISRTLGCNVGTTRSRLARARAALRDALEEVRHG